MKRVILSLIFLWMAVPGYAQNDNDLAFPKPFEFRVVDSTSATKDELYLRARTYVATTFKSAKDVVQMEDKDAGKIIGKGNFQVPMDNGFVTSNESWVSFTMTIDVKDGKFRCILSGFEHKAGYVSGHKWPDGGSLDKEEADGTSLSHFNKRQFKRIREKAMRNAKLFLHNFRIAMLAAGDTSPAAANDGY